jgi:hypothetical protein
MVMALPSPTARDLRKSSTEEVVRMEWRQQLLVVVEEEEEEQKVEVVVAQLVLRLEGGMLNYPHGAVGRERQTNVEPVRREQLGRKKVMENQVKGKQAWKYRVKIMCSQMLTMLC